MMNRHHAEGVYTPFARALHWLIAIMVAIMVPVGIVMSDRGQQNIWDGTTNALYSGHKLAGFILLWLMVIRVGYRLVNGAPPKPPGMPLWQRLAAGGVHVGLYVVLILLAISGWRGVSFFPALDIFGLFSLPALHNPDQAAAKQVFQLHKIFGFVLAGLLALHIGAALHHRLILKDGVMRRMWPQAK
jgi:cytochrome b561